MIRSKSSRLALIAVLVCVWCMLIALFAVKAYGAPITRGPDAIGCLQQALEQLEAGNPPGLTVEQYNAASLQVEAALAILYKRSGKP